MNLVKRKNVKREDNYPESFNPFAPSPFSPLESYAGKVRTYFINDFHLSCGTT